MSFFSKIKSFFYNFYSVSKNADAVECENIDNNQSFFGVSYGVSKLENAGLNKRPECVTTTAFFRDYDTLNFVAQYLNKMCPGGANVADFGCSTGEEAYSLAMMLDGYNPDKRYKITGYDIVRDVIESIPTHLYDIDTSKEDLDMQGIYVSNQAELEERNTLFYKFFEPSTEKTDKSQSFVVPKENAFDGVVNFQVADISDLGNKMHLEDNTNVVIFKNAFYHLIYNGPRGNPDLTNAEVIVEAVNKELLRNGLFVIGSYSLDHLYKCDKRKKTRLIWQDKKLIRVFDSSSIHKMLREKGFVPAYYERARKYSGEINKDKPAFPSVWKKAKNLQP